jgi:hypothetical protein
MTQQTQGWRERFYARVNAARIARWRRGELDAEGFVRAQKAWARNLVFALFGVVTAIGLVGDWLTHDRLTEEQLTHSLQLGGILLLFGLVVAFRLSRFAALGAYDFLVRRQREAAERHPDRDLTSRPAGGVTPALTFGFGSYQRSISFGNRVLLLALLCNGLLGGLIVARPQRVWMAPFIAAILVLALYKRFDRRPFLDISAEGIWCRAWGPRRHPFSTFKAVYPGESRMKSGVIFVPRSVAELKRTLPWMARYALRAGDGVPANAGTLAIWTTEVALDRDTFMREMQARILAARK